MKKVLMITYSFPPKGGGGVLRQLKFAKYLSQFGWQPFILTGDKYYFFQDKELLYELPNNCKIFRIPYLDPRNLIGSRDRLKQNKVILSHYSKSWPNIYKGWIKNILSYLNSFINEIFIPDIYILWILFAIYRGLEIIRDEDMNVIYSIDYPSSNHVLALILKIITKKPWIADFKDPWMKGWENKINRLFPFSWLDDKLLKLVLNYCDTCVTSDERIEKVLKNFISKQNWNKFIIIPNGFDEEDFEVRSFKKSTDIFTMTYIGTIYKNMQPLASLQAILNLIESKEIPQDAIRIKFIGSFDRDSIFNAMIYQSLLRREVIEIIGLVSHKEAIQYMISSDILLLINANVAESKYLIPSKIFEYLASGKPVIALVDEDGICANLIRKSNSGYVVPIDNEEKSRDVILRLFREFKKTGYLKVVQDRRYFESFERKKICGDLAKALDRIILTKKTYEGIQ